MHVCLHSPVEAVCSRVTDGPFHLDRRTEEMFVLVFINAGRPQSCKIPECLKKKKSACNKKEAPATTRKMVSNVYTCT